jgi:hypothetical protein
MIDRTTENLMTTVVVNPFRSKFLPNSAALISVPPRLREKSDARQTPFASLRLCEKPGRAIPPHVIMFPDSRYSRDSRAHQRAPSPILASPQNQLLHL